MAEAFARLSLAGRVIVITGAADGLGGATARLCAARGASVVLTDVNDAGGKALAADIERDGGKAVYLHTDVTSESDVKAMVDFAVSTYGKLDGAFNNAGIAGNTGAIADCSASSWQQHFDVNVTGQFLCLKYELPVMLAQGRGAIVNTASVAGVVGVPGGAAYVASKHASVGLARTAALECATQGVRVNALAPGSVDTPMVRRVYESHPGAREAMFAAHPMGRIGEPWEIAETVAWLLSDAASFVTGAIIAPDGGYTAR